MRSGKNPKEKGVAIVPAARFARRDHHSFGTDIVGGAVLLGGFIQMNIKKSKLKNQKKKK